MILQTIMLTNVLNNNDSYVCSSSLYIRFPLNAIHLQRHESCFDILTLLFYCRVWFSIIYVISVNDKLFQTALISIISIIYVISVKCTLYLCSAFINVWHNTLIHPLTRCKNFSLFFLTILIRWYGEL